MPESLQHRLDNAIDFTCVKTPSEVYVFVGVVWSPLPHKLKKQKHQIDLVIITFLSISMVLIAENKKKTKTLRRETKKKKIDTPLNGENAFSFIGVDFFYMKLIGLTKDFSSLFLHNFIDKIYVCPKKTTIL